MRIFYNFQNQLFIIKFNLCLVFIKTKVPMEIIESKENTVYIVSLGGRLDIMNCEVVENKFLEVIDEKKETNLLVDCSALTFVSSAGLRLFIIALKKLNSKGGKMAFSSLDANTMKIFTISGYDKLFKIYKTREEALVNFN